LPIARREVRNQSVLLTFGNEKQLIRVGKDEVLIGPLLPNKVIQARDTFHYRHESVPFPEEPQTRSVGPFEIGHRLETGGRLLLRTTFQLFPVRGFRFVADPVVPASQIGVGILLADRDRGRRTLKRDVA